MEFKNLSDLLTKFKDEKTCIEYLAAQRWGNAIPICPYCKGVGAYNIEDGKRYKCKNTVCLKKFSIKVGTIFEGSNISLRTWFGAMYLITTQKKGISSQKLHLDLGITQKTAWFLIHRIRELIKDKDSTRLQEPPDENEISNSAKNLNENKSTENISVKIKKNILEVSGNLEKDNKIHKAKRTIKFAECLQPNFYEKVEGGVITYSDKWTGDNGTIDINKNIQFGLGSISNNINGDVHPNSFEDSTNLPKQVTQNIIIREENEKLDLNVKELNDMIKFVKLLSAN